LATSAETDLDVTAIDWTAKGFDLTIELVRTRLLRSTIRIRNYLKPCTVSLHHQRLTLPEAYAVSSIL
jgi:hypothetical protein